MYRCINEENNGRGIVCKKKKTKKKYKKIQKKIQKIQNLYEDDIVLSLFARARKTDIRERKSKTLQNHSGDKDICHRIRWIYLDKVAFI